MFNRFKKHKIYIFLVLLFFLLTLFIRLNNLKSYNTYWADDGGAHIDYIKIILSNNRLPELNETYLAWHEPVYYLVISTWIKVGEVFGFDSLNWWELLNVIFYFLFLILIWFFAYYYSNKNKWIALLNVFIFSIIFIGVKLSAYVNNEILVHSLILLLLILFLKFKLLNKSKEKKIIYWSLILSLACLVKITVWIIFLAVLLTWFIKFLITKKKYFLKYILLCFIVLFFINLPWIIYKQENYNGYFSINIYNEKPKQNIITSDAWKYIFSINTHIFTDYPYWYSNPESYFSILLSDSFGDYYNLFNNTVGIDNLSNDKKILIGNGRYTTERLWNALRNVNRIALFLFFVWFLGLFKLFLKYFKNKKIPGYDLFLILVMFGGWSASLFHNLRLPYLEVGVLKAHFIYFTYPILSLLAYNQWWLFFRKKLWWFMFSFLPWFIYLLLSWDILLVDFYG